MRMDMNFDKLLVLLCTVAMLVLAISSMWNSLHMMYAVMMWCMIEAMKRENRKEQQHEESEDR